jgi:hypothetical protein
MMIIMRLRERERSIISGEFREAQSKVQKTLNQEKGVTSTPKSGGNDDEKTTTFVTRRGQKSTRQLRKAHRTSAKNTPRSFFRAFSPFTRFKKKRKDWRF